METYFIIDKVREPLYSIAGSSGLGQPAYPYRTIISPTGIRLLVIHPDDDLESVIRCSLLHEIYYSTRGYAALKYFRHAARRRVLWVDAMCINQNDPDEKSEQVPIMGEIYSRATKVYAWLGEADRQIDCVFDILQEFRDRKREAKFPTHFDAVEQLSFHRQLFRDIYQDEAGTLPEQSDLDNNILHKEFN